MTSLEFWIYVTGAIAVLSCIPWLRVLRASMELSRARIFLRWRSYTRVLRIGGLAIVSFLTLVSVSAVLEPEERTLRTFMPVGMFTLLLQIGAVYFGWTVYDIARGPRKKSPVFLLLGPGLGIKAALLATGIPAILILLRLVLFIPYHSETVKARFFLHFARTHRAHRFMVILAVVGIIANIAYTAWNPAYLQDRMVLLQTPTGFGVLFFNLSFIAFAAFITWTMGGGSKK